MKKRVLSLLLSLILVLPVFLFASCVKTDDGIYTITFSINGEKTKVEVARGEIPVCPEEKLSWETSEHYYKVTGWDKEIVPAERNATYTATVGEYGLTLYEVVFVLPAEPVKVQTHEGEIPTPPPGYETDQTREYSIGIFKEWDHEPVAPTAANTENGKKKMTYTPIYTYEPRAVAKLLAAKDGAKGILTMTYDFGVLNLAEWVNAKNKDYGTKGTFMMIPNWGGDKPNFDGRASEWAALFSDETLEPECHSMTHSLVLPGEKWGSYEGSKYNNTQENYDVELVQSKAFIEAAFPGHAVLCLAPSNNTLSTYSFKSDGKGGYVRVDDGGAQAVANATYYAIRQGQRGEQSLDPAPDDNPGGWYNLYIRSFFSSTYTQEEKLENGKKWLDETVQNGYWMIGLCHGVKGSGASTSGDLTTENAEALYKYASDYIKTGKLWAATFGEATKYIRERQNTTVSARFENDSVLVDMTINRTTSEGKNLDESIFNYPLTVEVRVPDSWDSVYYTVGGKMQTAAVYTNKAGESFVKVDLIPGADGVTVTTAINKLGSK